jgi:ribosomal protein S18 acetylase RimI-like enzyme
VPAARRRGVGTALSGWLVARAFDRGDAFVHLHPTGDAAAAVYRRLGFRERAAVDIRVAG